MGWKIEAFKEAFLAPRPPAPFFLGSITLLTFFTRALVISLMEPFDYSARVLIGQKISVRLNS